jgi:AcrR family transcriptional regulator
MDPRIEQSVTHTRKPRGQGGSRRSEILEAAKKLFVEDGVGNVTMRRIASSVGVSPTALYLHFADKDAILAAIAQDLFTELLSEMEQNWDLRLTPLPRLRAGLRAYVGFGLAHPDEYRLSLMTRPCGPASCAVAMAGRSFALLQDCVTELIGEGVFRALPPERLAETLWAMMHGITALLLDQAENLATPGAVLIETAIDVIEFGMLNQDRRTGETVTNPPEPRS